MRPAAILLLAAAAATVPVTLSLAQSDEFYIEIGDDTDSLTAEKQWQELSIKHKNLLGKLTFFPKKVLRDGNEVATRIQAGPIIGKRKAQRLCAKLFAADTPCFVIEGLEQAPPRVMTSLGIPQVITVAHPIDLPWLAVSNPPIHSGYHATPEAPESDRGFLTWLLGDRSPDEPMSYPSLDAKKAKVNVAEAIRVPLTEIETAQTEEEEKPQEKLLPPAQETKAPEPAPLLAENTSSEDTPGWLNVDAFADTGSASSFWQEVRMTSPAATAGMRVRVTEQAVRRTRHKTSLNIGPFAAQSDAEEFCQNNIRTLSSGLRCRFDTNEPENASLAVIPQRRFNRGDLFNVRRNGIMAKKGPSIATLSRAAANQLYWVQVLSAGSQMDALHQWENIRNSNADLLGSMRSSVAASMAERGNYVVRIGPLGDNNDAMSLCGNLKTRGINCHVMQYSSM